MTRKMKDSGIEWIGEMNSNWETAPLKFILKERRQRNMPIITEERLSLSIGIGVTLYSEKTTNLDRFKDDVTQYKVVYPNDLVINSMNVIVGAEGISNYLGCVSPAYYVMYSDNVQKFITKYYDYCLKTSTIQKVLFCLGKGIMAIDRGEGRVNTCRLKVSSYDLGRLEFPVPSIDEQQRIVDYLDKKCTKIGVTIEKEKQVIEKLKEYKQSVITGAVTKGLNPNVKMKDSGVEWIGEIPEEWNIKRLRYIGKCQNGISKSAEYFGKGYPFISYGDVYKNIELPDTVEGLVESSDSDRKIYSVEKGDIFFTRTSETIEEIGLTCVAKNTIKDATFAGFLIRVRPLTSEIDVNYSKYYFSSNIHRKFFVKEMNLVTRASLSQELLKKLPVLLPKIEEQQEIANYLDKKCNAIDKAISNKEKLIEKLTEYKKSLIHECVTGKIEV